MNRTTKIIAVLVFIIAVSLVEALHAQCPCSNEGWEADVYPLSAANFPGGDGHVSYLDWLCISTFVTGLKAPFDDCAFTAADCAPRSTSGDGFITACDVVQAIRYAGGSDSLQAAGGPTNSFTTPRLPGLGNRRVYISGGNFIKGQTNVITISLDAAGDESAVGFSILYDPNQLQIQTNSFFPSYISGPLTTNGVLSVVAVAYYYLNPFPSFAVGSNQLFSLAFIARPGTNSSTKICFTNVPTVCEVASTNADPLQATFEAATFAVISPRPAISNPHWSSQGFHALVNGDAGSVYQVEASTDLFHWIPIAILTNNTGAASLFDPAATGQARQFYRAILLQQ